MLPRRFDPSLLWPPSLALYIVNQLLDSEPWAARSLLPFAGQSARLLMAPIDVTLSVDADGRFALGQESAPVTVTMRLPMSSLATVAMAPETAAAHVHIEGNAEFAQVLATLATHLRPDIEEQLSDVIGDVLAVRVVAGVRTVSKAILTSQQRLAENVAEYLLEERMVLVRPRDVDDLTAEVRVLRDDLARLEKRIERLGLAS